MARLHAQELHRGAIMAKAARRAADRCADVPGRRPARRPRRARAARRARPRAATALGARARRLERVVAERQLRGERRRVRAARAVRGAVGVALAGDLDERVAVEEHVGRLVAVAAGDDDGAAARARGPRARELARPSSRRRRPASTRASGRFGRDDRRARQRSASTSASLRVGVEQPRAGLGDHHRVEHDRRAGGQQRRAPRATASIVATRRRASRSSPRRRRCPRRRRGPARRSSPARPPRRASTPTVFCAVIAVIAVVPCTPQRANALRSAWMPGAAAGVRAGDREARRGCGRARRHGGEG